jgi:hypothetical protein
MRLGAIQRSQLFLLLHKLDVEEAKEAQAKSCSCGGRLHSAKYRRKPRGGPADLPEEYCFRLSFCCDREGCRKRVLPPSALFWGRRVYWGVVLWVVTALRQQRLDGFTAKRVQELFGIRRPTLDRWMRYFREIFPRSRSWQRVRGRISPAVSNQALPSALIEAFVQEHGSPEQALPPLLGLLDPDGS